LKFLETLAKNRPTILIDLLRKIFFCLKNDDFQVLFEVPQASAKIFEFYVNTQKMFSTNQTLAIKA
jgi:hypothetical protein